MNSNIYHQHNYIIRRIPMVRICLAFAAGILLSDYLAYLPSISGYIAATLLALAVIGSFPSIYQKFFGYSLLPSLSTLLLIIFAGYLNGSIKNTKPPSTFETRSWSGYIVSDIKSSDKYLSFIAKIYQNNKKPTAPIKCLLYIPNTAAEHPLSPGSEFSFVANIDSIPPPLNPYGFDYARFMQIKNDVHYRAFVDEANFASSSKIYSRNINIIALRWRQQLIRLIERHPFTTDQKAILYALTLGYKNLLTDEIVQEFSNSGAMHVLAISGLHMGIFYIILQYLFQIALIGRWNRYSRQILIIITLWLITFITGFGPSAIRAACMFSFFAVGKMFRQRTNIYNILASSAFLMLLLNPNLLWSVSFQLSYTAVLGIISLQPIFYRWLQLKNKVLDYFYQIITVSLAAQLATTPLTLYYFSQFPVYFALTNLLLIPMVFATLLLFILFIAALPIGILSKLLFYPLKFLLASIASWVKVINQLPYAVVSNIDIPLLSAIMLAITIVLFTFAQHYNKRRTVIIILSGLLVVNTISAVKDVKIINSSEWVIFHSYKKHILLHRQGKQCSIWMDHKVRLNSDEYTYTLSPYLRKLRCKPNHFYVNYDSLLARQHLGFSLNDQNILLLGKGKPHLPEGFANNIRLILPYPATSPKQAEQLLTEQAIWVFDGSIASYTYSNWLKNKAFDTTMYYNTNLKGAMRWSPDNLE